MKTPDPAEERRSRKRKPPVWEEGVPDHPFCPSCGRRGTLRAEPRLGGVAICESCTARIRVEPPLARERT